MGASAKQGLISQPRWQMFSPAHLVLCKYVALGVAGGRREPDRGAGQHQAHCRGGHPETTDRRGDGDPDQRCQGGVPTRYDLPRDTQ